MHSLSHHGSQRVLQQSCLFGLKHARNASLTSAINRGIRKGANTLDRLGTTPRRSEKDEKPDPRRSTSPKSRFEIDRLQQSPRPPKKRWGKDTAVRTNISHEAPLGVPYTTAGSEFLYGTFAVKAALQAQRRQLHKIYIWRGEGSSTDEHDDSIIRLARSKQISVYEVAGSWDKMLLKMSGQRPHNGYVLEASPIPKLPITALERVESPDSNLTLSVPPQSIETQAVNATFKAEGSTATIVRSRTARRYPLLLWLDRVTDTGNLGAIMRTAYFFGIDAILIPEHGTAPFGPITVKASAGTAEYVPVLTVRKELDFVQSCQKKGWKFFAAVAPEKTPRRSDPVTERVDSAVDALDKGPCVLMVGNEAEGLRTFMQKAADEPISIKGAIDNSGVVDSLNVSVAAALLVARFLTPSQTSSSPATQDTMQNETVRESSSNDMF